MTEPVFYYRIDAIEDRTPYTFTFDGGEPVAKPRCTIRHCRLVRTTPNGVIVDNGYGEEKYIGKAWTKQYAHPTKEAALEAFIARRQRWIRFLRRDLKRAEQELAFAEKMQVGGVVE